MPHPSHSSQSFRPRRFGRFVLTARVGAGATAEVFRAHEADSVGNRDYAIKRILPHIGQQQEFADMFVEEANVMVSLDHPCIVQVYEFGEVEEVLYIAMEYVHGMDVRELVMGCRQKGHRLPPTLAVYIAMETLRGLDFAHNAHDSQGRPLRVIHRDVSPGNILVTWTGDVKLSDFGIARTSMSRSLSLIAANAGKLGYMSPEQVLRQNVDRGSDIFSLATVLYELLTGYPLFDADSELDTMLAIRDVDYGTRLEDADYIPRPIRSILARALARSPGDRFQSAAAFYRALDSVVEELDWRRNADALGAFLQREFESEYAAHSAAGSFDLPLDTNQRRGGGEVFWLEETDPAASVPESFFPSTHSAEGLVAANLPMEREPRETINLIVEPADPGAGFSDQAVEELQAFDLLADVQPREASVEILAADADGPVIDLQAVTPKHQLQRDTGNTARTMRPPTAPPAESVPHPSVARVSRVIEEELILDDDDAKGFIASTSAIADTSGAADVDFELGFDDFLEEPSGDFDELLDGGPNLEFPTRKTGREREFDSREYLAILEESDDSDLTDETSNSQGTVPGYPYNPSTPPRPPSRPPTPPPVPRGPPRSASSSSIAAPGVPSQQVNTRSEVAGRVLDEQPETTVAEAIHLRRHRKLEQAMQLLENEFYGDEPVCAMLEHAQCRLELGQATEAARELTELIEAGLLSRSDTRLAEYYRALAYEYLGRKDDAVREMTRLKQAEGSRFPDLGMRLERMR